MTERDDEAQRVFALERVKDLLQGQEPIAKPHAFTAHLRLNGQDDAAVSVLVIARVLLARVFGRLWMDPMAGIAGIIVIAAWSYGLVRNIRAILLDTAPDRVLLDQIRVKSRKG